MKVTEETAALVAQAQSGDLEAFGRLYEYVYTDLYRYAYYQLGHAEAAEDAVQETALEAFRGIRKLKNAGAFRCWIFTILSARCNRGIRDLCRQRGQNPLEDAQLSVSDFTEKSDEAIRLYEAIADLPEEDRRLSSPGDGGRLLRQGNRPYNGTAGRDSALAPVPLHQKTALRFV